MIAHEVLTENAKNTDTEVFAQIRFKDSKAEPMSLKAKLGKVIHAFAELCNRLDMDERWLRP
jgi:hypothetical protein